MTPRILLYFIAAVLAFAPLLAKAQGLAEVLSSIQERKRAVAQAGQVMVSLRNEQGGSASIPDQELIEWEFLNGVDFPTEEQVSGLSAGSLVALLNQAVLEFDGLLEKFINVNPDHLTVGSHPGDLRAFRREDFEPVGRVSDVNYHQALLQLARNLGRLKVLPWPFSGKKNTKFYVIYWSTNLVRHEDDSHTVEIKEGEHSIPFAGWSMPTSLGPGAIPANYPPTNFVTEDISSESVATGISHYLKDAVEDPISYDAQFLSCHKEVRFLSEARLMSKVTGRNDQVDGKLSLVARNQKTSLPPNGYSAPADWNSSDGVFIVRQFVETPGTVPLGANGPDITINLGWFNTPLGELDVCQSGLPFGYPLHTAAVVGGSGSPGSGRDGGNGSPADLAWRRSTEFDDIIYGTNPVVTTVLSRTNQVLFLPSFNKGLDASGGQSWSKLKSAGAFDAGPAGDGGLILNPEPGVLVKIPLGCGLGGDAMTGAVGIPVISTGPAPASGLGDGYRFDFSSMLQFLGPEQDFHVVHATDRSAGQRGALMPVPIPDETTLASSGWNSSWNGNRDFRSAWDLPRLRQVVGRDLIADISVQGHYQATIRIYRRPLDAVAVDRTPGHLESVSQTNLIRTYVLANPDAGIEAYPTTPEKLVITDDSGAVHTISRNVIDPDAATLTFDTTNGTHCYYHKTISRDSETSEIAISESVDGSSVRSGHTGYFEWWNPGQPRSGSMESESETISWTSVSGYDAAHDSYPLGTQEGRYPKSITINSTARPNAPQVISWDDNGVVSGISQTPWSSVTTDESGVLRTATKYNGTLAATTWTEFLNGGKRVKTYSAPDGGVTDKGSADVDWSELQYGDTNQTGLPGLPHKLTRKDGSGTTWDWTVSSNGSGTATICDGKLDNGSVTKGFKRISTTNQRGYPIATDYFLVQGASEVKTGGTSTPSGQFSTWEAPLKGVDFTTGMATTQAFAGNRERLSSATDALGVTTAFTTYDPLDRLTAYTWDGHAGSMKHNDGGFNLSGTLAIPGRPNSFSQSWDAAGRFNAASVTAGATRTLNVTRNSDTEILASSDTATTASGTVVIRNADGSVATASGNTRPFGGTADPDGLGVDGGLLKTRTKLTGQAATFLTTWTDAWGRIRKTEAPSASGTGSALTQYFYSDPNSSLKSTRTTDADGRKTITESDPYNSSGAITRSGIDVNGDGILTANSTDRYVESSTTVSGANSLVTTLKLTEDTGLREILRTTWAPAGDVTITTINGNEETITRTPNYSAKTVTTSSTKGWSKTETFNNLGLTTNSNLSGPGIPSAELNPAWRADGSLASVSLNIGGKTHAATFQNDGTLASLTAPGRGNILGSHTISGGTETLTVDGTTITRKLDGTEESTSGSDVSNKIETLVTNGSGFKQTTTPAVGAATTVSINAAGAPTEKNYAAGSGEGYTHTDGGLLSSVTLARGGSLAFGYSNDGAKDLTSATWPIVASGVFTVPAVVQGYGYDHAGRLKEIGDSSGVRSLTYQNGRLKQTVWNSGTLTGYKVVRGLDSVGRETGFEIWRGNALIQAAAQVSNGVSGEISSISSGTFTATYGRDASRNITSITRGSVTQNWPRDGGGITAANNSVSGAPTFTYTEFDAKGRRKKCTTAGGEWTYTYGASGQLTSAIHPTQGSFTYAFDAIGRRTDKGSANTSDLLNRTLAWTNSQNKTLKVTAAPAARVWVGIGTAAPTEISNFTGNYSYAIPSPGAPGGWVAWNTLVVLTGQGDAGANADAKAEKSGAVWVPPISESFSYDNAGNRQSSALWDFGWNAKNELVRARTKNYNSTPQGYDITNAYDAEGRRFSKKVNRYQNGGIVEQKVITLLHEGNNLIYERHQLPSGLTTLERKYLWGPDIANGAAGGAGGLLLIQETKGNETIDLYPLYDGNGNVIALADSSGILQAEYAYGPFGERLYTRGPKAASCPFRYATKYLDEETGLYNFGRRFLDPITGQWLSREILGESESINLYAYCHNDPINFVDVLGLAKHGLLYQFFFGIDPIELEPSSQEKALRQSNQSDTIRFITMLNEMQSGQRDSTEFLRRLKILEQANQEEQEKQDALTRGIRISPIKPQMPMVAIDALSLGAAPTEFNANMNSSWLVPTGAGAMGLKFAFGEFKALLPIISTGAKVETTLLSTEMRTGEMFAAKGLPNSYAGIQDASAYLKTLGVSRAERVRYLQSFEPQNMAVRQAGQSEFGLRFFSDSNRAGGQYLFETFPASRSSLAVKPDWSTMSGFRQFQIRPGAMVLEGRAASQGANLSGGQMQKFILDWRSDLIAP